VLSQEGARNGPSLMPGGTREAYALMEPVITKIAAQVDGHACVTYIGELGSGNYVKMVHNGIEYGDMQLIAEAYEVLRKVWCFPPRVAVTALRPYLSILCDRRWECPAALCVCVCAIHSTCRDCAQIGRFNNDELHAIFAEWNRGDLESFLIEITAKIFTKKDDLTDDGFLVDKILDKTGMKGVSLCLRWLLLLLLLLLLLAGAVMVMVVVSRSAMLVVVVVLLCATPLLVVLSVCRRCRSAARRHGQVDDPGGCGALHRGADDVSRAGRALPLCAQGRPRGREPHPDGPDDDARRGPLAARRRRPPGAVRRQDLQLRAGTRCILHTGVASRCFCRSCVCVCLRICLRICRRRCVRRDMFVVDGRVAVVAGHEPHPRGCEPVGMERQPRRVRAHLEGRLHHPCQVPRPVCAAPSCLRRAAAVTALSGVGLMLFWLPCVQHHQGVRA
jgi:hypothetical protein